MPQSKENIRKTLLIADDEDGIRNYVEAVLKDHYEVLLAVSGEDALQKSRAHMGVIHLLLSNVQMPGMTGIELGTKMNLERPEMRVMLMSGYASGVLILNAGWHFLDKPFLPSKLLGLVSTVLALPEPVVTPAADEHGRAR